MANRGGTKNTRNDIFLETSDPLAYSTKVLRGTVWNNLQDLARRGSALRGGSFPIFAVIKCYKSKIPRMPLISRERRCVRGTGGKQRAAAYRRTKSRVARR